MRSFTTLAGSCAPGCPACAVRLRAQRADLGENAGSPHADATRWGRARGHNPSWSPWDTVAHPGDPVYLLYRCCYVCGLTEVRSPPVMPPRQETPRG